MPGVTYREMFGEDAYYREKFKDRKANCPKCGSVASMGTGERPCDFRCPNCGQLFNGAGQCLRSDAEVRRIDPFGDGYDYCGNDYDYEPED
jgi:ribosomal protein S27AE